MVLFLPLPPMELLAVNVGYYSLKGTALLVAHRQIKAERVEQRRWTFKKTINSAREYLLNEEAAALACLSSDLRETLAYHKDHQDFVATMPETKHVQIILRQLCLAAKTKKRLTKAITPKIDSFKEWVRGSQRRSSITDYCDSVEIEQPQSWPSFPYSIQLQRLASESDDSDSDSDSNGDSADSYESSDEHILNDENDDGRLGEDSINPLQFSNKKPAHPRQLTEPVSMSPQMERWQSPQMNHLSEVIY